MSNRFADSRVEMIRRTWSGKAAKGARASLGLKADEVAERLDVDRASIYGWEAGREPQLRNALRLADLYGVSIDSLFVHEDESTTPPVACAMSGAGNDEVRGAQSPQADRAADPTEGA